MDRQRVECLKHDKNNEILCKTCKLFICSRCITDHTIDGHKPEYIHIFDYAPKEILPNFDSVIIEMKKNQKQTIQELKDLVYALFSKLHILIDQVDLQNKKCNELIKSMRELNVFNNQSLKSNYSAAVSTGLILNKKRLEQALVDKNVDVTLNLTIKAETEAAQANQSIADLLNEMNKTIDSLNAITVYDKALNAAEAIMNKCIPLKPVISANSWTCDKKYLSQLMYLSEDGLVFGASGSKKYVGIIGTLAFDKGMYAFAVIPEELDCPGKEGFGIIEKSKYLEAHKANAKCPEVYNKMIGYMYKGEAKNMHGDTISDMQMKQKYYVRINLTNYNLNITGPGLSLSAELIPDVEYYPCFSCGCSKNRMKIIPLASYDDY